MERRAFLSRAGFAIAGSVVGAGCGGDENATPVTESTPFSRSSAATPEEQAEETPAEASPPDVPEGFDAVVDVSERGADSDGEESVVPLLEEIDADGTLVYFPPGRYRMDGAWVVEEFQRIGVVGEDATIVPDAGIERNLFSLDGRNHAAELRFEGLAFDYTRQDIGGRLLHAKARDGLVVRDVEVAGPVDHGQSLVRVDVTDPTGTGLVENLRLPDGARSDTSTTGCYVGNSNQGEIRFRSCWIEGFPDNGLYADPPAGRIIVDGGYYANNGISNVRVRGGSIVRGARILCDNAELPYTNLRGIRLTDYEANPDAGPALVENCEIKMVAAPSSDGAITLGSELSQGRIRNTTIRVDMDNVHAILAKAPEPVLRDETEPRLVVENVTINGSAAGAEAVLVIERNGCLLEDLLVVQSGADRGGITFRRSQDNVLRNTHVDVTGTPVKTMDATVDIQDLEVPPEDTHPDADS